MDRTALEERENILKIMYDEMENQPMASQKTRDTYSALHDAVEAYVNATQEDAFTGIYDSYEAVREKPR